MNRDEILNMPAGREMDELILTKIFGYTKLPFPAMPEFQKPTDSGVYATYHVNHYSTDMKAAWDLVKEMSAKGYWCYMGTLSSESYAIFTKESLVPLEKGRASVYDLPLAICRAALLTVCE